MRVLAGDVGGTHARLAIIEIARDGWTIETERRYDSREFDGLAAVVNRFREDVGADIETASLGVACAIEDHTCHLTNLDWTIDVRSFPEEIGIANTRILNDFQALAHALPLLGPEDRAVLQTGEPRERAPIGVIGAGTGLGEAYVVWDAGHYRVHASEGGHADLSPRSPIEWRLSEYLRQQYGHASWERAVSGPGIVNIYQFLVAEGAEEQPETVQAMRERDAAAVISERGLDETDPLCSQTLDVFTDLYGNQAGNLALTIKAEGGLYVGGGIAPKVLDRLRGGPFLDAFRRKGRMAELVARIPVWVILNEDVGLIGAAAAALPE